MRRKKVPEKENHERWLVSYADFITLLFAFFVVLFASSQTDKGRAQQVSESVKKALEENQVATALAGILGGTVDRKGIGNAQMRGPGGAQKLSQQTFPSVVELQASERFLARELKNEIEAGKVVVQMTPRGLVVSLQEAAFFSPGDDRLAPESFEILEKIAEAIRKLPNPIRLEGHTDSLPIHNARFRSNWELSASRSIAMMEFLRDEFGIASQRMAIAGYADTAPVADNSTPEGRARNRRVDIVILNRTGMISEPFALEHRLGRQARSAGTNDRPALR
ncbi:MAG: OmpA family protein [Bryobacteraceae bacterium]|nr:OmpA family protein [Bryobacteraceae bacterium]MDW8379438.1 flagellar motor protein MotB [Bryobacterales bacterium]